MKMTPEAPNASAARKIDPAFPGSCIPSRIMTRGCARSNLIEIP